MTTLTYATAIRAPRQAVWNAITGADAYGQWARAFSPGSRFEGEWTEGSPMRFVDAELGGTLALLEEVVPFRRIRARHTAVITAGGAEDTESPEARKWIGSVESYLLEENGGVTSLTVEMQVHEDLAAMFDDCWPNALGLLKALCEAPDG